MGGKKKNKKQAENHSLPLAVSMGIYPSEFDRSRYRKKIQLLKSGPKMKAKMFPNKLKLSFSSVSLFI